MIHVCKYCDNWRDCDCGDCGESKEETCTSCNNVMILALAGHLNIPVKKLGMDPLGGYHFKTHHDRTPG